MDQTTERERQAFYEQMAPGFFEYLRSHMSSIEQVELAVTREGIVSFPAIQELGGVQKTVRVPLSLLTIEFDAELALMEEKVEYARQQANYAKAQADAVYQAGVYAAEKGDYALSQGNAVRATKDVIEGWFDPFRDEVESWATDAAAAESQRASAELLRQQQELARVDAEGARRIAELQRVYEENLRKASSLDMQAAELSRVREELLRKAAEAQRQENESQRQSDDAQRHTLINRAVASSYEAAAYSKQQGDRAKDYAEHQPIVVDGYWHIWNEELQEYVSSHQAVPTPDMFTDEEKEWMLDHMITPRMEGTHLVFPASTAINVVGTHLVFGG